MLKPQDKIHDLHNFMRQISDEMSSEYDRIHKRASEDPGTAGDEGEENWAQLLRDWLPRTYEVVTKGRLISQDGTTSPQIDVLVLSGAYPKKLLNKKIYLAAGVVAAFECKTTLKAVHVLPAFEVCAEIKKMFPNRIGKPYKELHSPIICGLLAHSHSWKSKGSSPEKIIWEKIIEADQLYVSHPRLQLDVFCVADLASWSSMIISTFFGPRQFKDWSKMAAIHGPNGSASSSYVGWTKTGWNPRAICNEQATFFTPVGALLSCIIQKLAWEDPSLRGIADYYRTCNISGSGFGLNRQWPSSIYSDEIRARVEASVFSNKPWGEWRPFFP